MVFEATMFVDAAAMQDETLRILDDEELVTACLAGTEAAWATLLMRYSKLIYTIPLRFGFPPSIAEEVFQEVCLTLLEKLTTLRERRRFSTWLVTVTRRACLQRLRYQQPLLPLESAEEVTLAPHTPETVLLFLEQQEMVHRALAKLDVRCQHLVRMLFFEPVAPSYEEIAKLLRMPEGSVGPTRARCLEKMRNLLLEDTQE